ncbi:hypothetical protein GBA63_18515 [Rubrobacter tropicus]|uniref:Uncharacterized protein n=1 Tax=Rubrobacter tropicus TaxID=2653851 RepID=A0A6G8QD26_9ACTN|nr:hypothetical protein [Rubrobacter tropicus]QIN84410.1 hypothetical protein GBA63_18515 [Rubrobacter tropicus]
MGEPGIGKTTALRDEWEKIEAGGDKTIWISLGGYGSETRLARRLFGGEEFAGWRSGDYRLHVFLDGLDECRLLMANVVDLLLEELAEHPVDRLSLRIGCRTADWPKKLEGGMNKLWREGSVGVYELAPLRRVDVAVAAETNDMSPDSFLAAVNEAEAVPLAIKPVTLEFLLDSYRETGGFPKHQADLYLDGCRRLCEERNEDRVDRGLVGELSADQRLAVAARMAALTIFSGKQAVWTGLERAVQAEDDIPVRELAYGAESVSGQEFPVGEAAIREVLDTGLFSARGSERLGWAHQTYAEFLAALYLARRDVGVEQAMSLILHPDDEEGRLVPQLHETAAWLASVSDQFFWAVMDSEPEVLLRSDVASTDVEARAGLVAAMLRLYDEGKLLDIGLIPHKDYRKLAHPGLAEQLRPYIADATRNFVVRRVALDIAEACELRTLQGTAAEVALDASQPHFVRKEAASFVAHVGDGPTRSLLRPLALGEAGEDPNGDLRGWGLHALWPEHLTADELFRSLARPNDNYFGSYASFLNDDLPERLRPADLPEALAWVEGQQRRHEASYRLAGLMDQIMLRAWDHLDDPGVKEAFARAALARLRKHDEIVQERRPVFVASDSDEPSFRNRVAADDRKRRGLMVEMLGLLQDEDDGAWLLVQYKTPLLLAKDAAWLIGELEAAPPGRGREVLAALVRRSFYGWGDEQHELLYLAYQRTPALADEVGRFFDPVELSSTQAEEQRRYHRESLSWRENREESPPPDPPLKERILRALDDAEAGDVGAFWRRVDYFLKFDEDGRSRVSPTEWDLTALPGWEAADAATRDRIVGAAERYVLEGEPELDGWLGEGSIWEAHPTDAGYRALRLLVNLAPDFVAEIPDEAWERWAAAILGYPISTSTEGMKPHHELVAMAYRHAPGTVIDTALFLIDKENEEQGFLSVTRDLEKCWDDRLAHALLRKAQDERLKPSCLSSLLNDLLDYGLDEAEAFAESLVVSGAGNEEEGARARAVVAAGALIFHAADAGWSVVWPALQRDEGFADELVDAIASTAHHSNRPQKRLSESEAADLYIWLMDRYPPSEYFMKYRDDGHLTAIGLKESIAMWRDDIPGNLRGRGTFEACRQIERIMEALPALLETLRWTLYQARAEARLKTWTAPDPTGVRKLTAERTARLVRNGDQLLDVVIESLGRLEDNLRGETPAAPDLWNERDDGTQRPKGEERFSDYVKRHLQEDLERRGVVVNREVVISRGEGESKGRRTDIRVDATVRGPRTEEYGPVTVIIEAKGNWYQRLYHEMEAQLAGRYLRDNRCRHGLYLVGWFNCPQWDKEDPRHKTAMRRDPKDALRKLNAKAAKLSQGDLRVEAFLINAALR